MSKLGNVLSKEVYCNNDSNVSQTEPPATIGYGGLGAKLPAAGRFFVIFWEKNCFNTIGSHFARILSHSEVLDFQHLKAN